jgi:hypothetical protein
VVHNNIEFSVQERCPQARMGAQRQFRFVAEVAFRQGRKESVGIKNHFLRSVRQGGSARSHSYWRPLPAGNNAQ